MADAYRMSRLFALLCLISPAALHAQNVVTNGDFEAAQAAWTGGALSGVSPHGGQACIEVVDASATISVEALSSLAPLPNRGPYRFSLWARTDMPAQVGFIVLKQYRGDGTWISGANIELPLTIGTAWTKQSFPIRALHAETAQLQVSLLPVRWTATGELMGRAFFDDIALEPSAEVVEGSWLAAADGQIWLPPVEQKVRPQDVLPTNAPIVSSLRMEAAIGEWESAQVALRFFKDDELMAVRVTDLANAASVIPGGQVEVRAVAYVTVASPTDFTSFSGEIPDPLPKLTLPLALGAGRQQSLWLTLHVPDDAKPGVYRGTLELTFATVGAMTVPLEVKVWNIRLGRERHLRTGYALSLDRIDRYHNLGGDPGRRKAAFRAYLENFSDHGVSVMDVTGDDGFRYRFDNLGWPLETVVPDPTGPMETNRVMRVEDNDAAKAVGVVTREVIALERGKDYVLSWRTYSDEAHDYTVALSHYDADGNWVSGSSSIEITRSSQALWQTESVTIDEAQLTAPAVRVHLFARRYTDAGELEGTTFFDDVSLRAAPGGAGAGTGAEQVINGDFQTTNMDAQVTVDFSRFDQAAAFALDTLGMNAFVIDLPFFASGTWQAQRKPSLLGYAWGTPEYEALYLKILQTLEAHLSQKGWLGKAYTYWFDEPQPKDYPFVKQGMSLIERGAPHLLRLLTEEYDSVLDGDVDIWAPLLNQHDASWANDRQSLGNEVWWYVATDPKAPYPNNFIDHPALEHRLRFWMAWKWNVEGDIYALTNWWTNDEKFPPPNLQDPWVDPMSYGQEGEWGNGDSRLFYPPRAWKDGKARVEGPTPSLRWELIREGIDDYEYLWRLRSSLGRLRALDRPFKDDALIAQATKLLELPDWLIATRVEYTADLAAFAAYRRQVATTLEAIEAALTPPADGHASVNGGCSFPSRRFTSGQLLSGARTWLGLAMILACVTVRARFRSSRLR